MIIISPSGNLYGSEQVLIDFLENSLETYTVYAPKKSLLFNKLKSSNKHLIFNYNQKYLKLFYIKILFKLLLNGKETVYINEAGHIKYIKLLAKFFKSKNFFVHLRIIEDTNKTRLGFLSENIKLITVSDFMKKNLNGYACKMIYDPYPFSDNKNILYELSGAINLGIVGRITNTKGFNFIETFINKINQTDISEKFMFHFYGTISNDANMSFGKLLEKYSNITFHGFISEKSKIYNNIDVLLHFNQKEPLGRIILEALDYNKPFICSNSGGTGEIVNLLELEYLGIDFNQNYWSEVLLSKINELKNNYNKYVNKIAEAKLKAKNIFSVIDYVNNLESIFKK